MSSKNIYVIGPPRSGSTLVYNILCSAGTTNQAINETHILPELARTCHTTIGRLQIEQGNIFSDKNEIEELFTQYSRSFMQRLAGRFPEAETLVIKSIIAANVAPVLARLNPDMVFCICVRDPRDIVASMIDVGKKQEAKGRPNQYPRNIERLAKMVYSSYAACLLGTTEAFNKNAFVVEYKYLVENFSAAIDRLEQDTGLDLGGFDPAGDWKNSKIDIEKRKREGAPFLTELWGKPVTKTSLGSYREKLSANEISRIETICKPVFDRYSF